ncbi:hypothetical protein ACWDBW_39265 [Streptomyces sp. NPDC001107]
MTSSVEVKKGEQVNLKYSGIVTAAAAVVALGMSTGTASAQDWLTAHVPTQHGNKITWKASVLGPQPAGSKLCVSALDTSAPEFPPIELASKCVKTQAGSVSITLTINKCQQYMTMAFFHRAGSGGTSTRQSNYLFACPSN